MTALDRRSVAPSPSGWPGYHVKEEFWRGFGLPGCPRLEGKSVLEVGCGEGNRSCEVAAHGAARVVGIDVFASSIRVARERLLQAPDAWRDRVTFVHAKVEDLEEGTFDVVVSEDVLEHVMDVPNLLGEIRRRLSPGGRAYIGFGPPFHAPEGDHGWLRAVLPGRRFFAWPWGHLLLRRVALRKLSEQYGKPIARTHDWPYDDLNQLTLNDYLRMFERSGLKTVFLHRNHVHSLAGRLFGALGRLPVLSRYCTLNIFVIFEKPA